MDLGPCNIIYFDPRASTDRTVDRNRPQSIATRGPDTIREKRGQAHEEIEQTGRALLANFKEVNICKTAESCVVKIREHRAKSAEIPTLLLIYVPEVTYKAEQIPAQKSSLDSGHNAELDDVAGLYGLNFLQYVQASGTIKSLTSALLLSSEDYAELCSPKRKRTYADYFALGAVDVLKIPLTSERASSLPAHAFRTIQSSFGDILDQESSPNRRSSWVGVGEAKPYAYLRESMVSGLMDRICDPSYVEKPINLDDLKLSPERKSTVARAVGVWHFSAHDFSDDELLYGAFLMLRHVLKMGSLEKWRLSDDDLLRFLMACRRVYNSFVIYHNFRHACDVLQATFCFLIKIGVVPAFSGAQHHENVDVSDGTAPKGLSSKYGSLQDDDQINTPDSAYASLLRPFEAMTLVISCIGHDVGHPGVNNLFLVTLNAPLAQLYNDRSVLESFHCAAFSQILRRFWPVVFSDVALRKLMINTILATDMGHHTHYVDKFENMREEFVARNFNVDSLDQKSIDGYRELICCMLIKCADICNVARKYNVATEWADILTSEFANQAVMEAELEMPSCLLGGAPVLNDLVKMGTGQIGFMNFFAIPMFTGMSLAFPGMQFTVEELKTNKSTWERVIEDEKQKALKDTASTASKERAQSPHARRGSAYAQSQMRADPMVFGSHSSSSLNQGRRQSGSVSSELVANAARRSSLGPTVMPSSGSVPNSRRASAGVIRADGLSQRAHEASGMGNAVGFDSRLSDATPNSSGNAPRSSTTVGSTSARDLITHPPGFVSKDPALLSPSRSDVTHSPPLVDWSSATSHSVARGRGKDSDAGQSPGPSESVQSGTRPRSRSGRKFSLKFWRKAKSTDHLPRDVQ